MADPAPAPKKLRPLRGLLPFIAPYKRQVALALLFLVLGSRRDAGHAICGPGCWSTTDWTMPAAANSATSWSQFGATSVCCSPSRSPLGVFTAARFSWSRGSGERVTGRRLRHAVYSHVLTQSPQFFETLKTGEVLSRLTTDTTVIQNAVGSSISMGLRNAVLFVGGIAMLIATSPRLMLTVVGIIALVVAPAMLIGGARAAAVAREPGSHCRLKRDRRRSAERGSGGAELHAGARRDTPILRGERARFRDVDPAHRHARPADGRS